MEDLARPCRSKVSKSATPLLSIYDKVSFTPDPKDSETRIGNKVQNDSDAYVYAGCT